MFSVSAMFSIRIIVITIYVLSLSVAICTAFPTYTTEQSNQMVIGVALLCSIGIAAVSCLCCRRRKRGFEINQTKDIKEFINEGGVRETSLHSEFPIFRAISHQNDQAIQANDTSNLSPPVVTGSQNLLITDSSILPHEADNFDNNNILLSSAQHENIANNNAIVPAASTSAPNGVAVLIEATEIANHPNYHIENAPLQLAQPPFYSNNSVTAIHNRFDTFSNFTQSFYQSESQYGEQQYRHVANELMVDGTSMYVVDKPTMSASFSATNPFNHSDIERVEIILHDDNNIDDECGQIAAAGDDIDDKSINAFLSTRRRSCGDWEAVNLDDSSSVEEALRALDNAIADGDHLSITSYSDDDDDGNNDDNVEETIEPHVEATPSVAKANADLHHVLTQFLGQHSANQSSDCGDDEINSNETKPIDVSAANTIQSKCESVMYIIQNHLNPADVYEQAEELVDDVIAQCEAYENRIERDIDKSMVANDGMDGCDDDFNDATQILCARHATNNDDEQMPRKDRSADADSIESCSTNTTFNSQMNNCDTLHVLISDTINIDNFVAKNESSLLLPMPDVDDVAEMTSASDALEDSIDDTFNGNIIASTPCVKLKMPSNVAQHPSKTIPFECLPNFSDYLTETLSGDQTADNEHRLCNDATFVAANDRKYAKEGAGDGDCTFVLPVNRTTNGPDVNVVFMEPAQSKLDRDDINSDDLNTATPLNTPIEINYANFTWEKVKSNQNSLNAPPMVFCRNTNMCADANIDDMASVSGIGDGTFVKPSDSTFVQPHAVDGTFDADEYCRDSDENEDDENARENMNFTLSELRKQLTLSLPHASGSMTSMPPADNDSDEDDTLEEAYNEHQRSPERETQPEIIINYKRQLSPIIEESDEETCRTMQLHETVAMDSTSTGCVETAEAIMGVTKVLMASNDTLFNFEDTLGDRERDDLLTSPRNCARASSNTTSTDTSSLADYQFMHDDSSIMSDCELRTYVADGLLALKKKLELFDSHNDLEEHTIQAINELLSPEQQRTFSEEIHTIEQLSSDLSGTVDATTYTANTLDDLKTCISVHSKEDRSSLSALDCIEHDQPVAAQTSPCDVDLSEVGSATQPGNNDSSVASHSCIPNQVDIVHISDDDDSSSQDLNVNDTKENLNPNVGIFDSKITNEVEKVVTQTSRRDDFGQLKVAETVVNAVVAQTNADSQLLTIPNTLDTKHNRELYLSIDADQSLLNTNSNADAHLTEATNAIDDGLCEQHEWDSDIEDSNSSEEFMYVRNYPTMNGDHGANEPKPRGHANSLDRRMSCNDEHVEDDDSDTSSHQYNPSNSVWNSHEDQVQIMSKDGDETPGGKLKADDSSSDAEIEWVPSSWSSLAQPSRSAMKSPDKSENSYNKNRRSVVFKQQSYHSVYVYPKEMTVLSPAYSEPQMSQPYATESLFSSNDDSDDAELNGFNVSSSTRPFGSQFNAQCHTWPTDSDFSWSKFQDSDLGKDNYPTYSDASIHWPKKFSAFYYQNDDNKYGKDEEYTRADSGVGESAEILSEAMSLGDLCHTKASLRLPLKPFPCPLDAAQTVSSYPNADTMDETATKPLIFPTESLDSLCTSSVNSADKAVVHFPTIGHTKSTESDSSNDKIDSSTKLITDLDDNIDNQLIIDSTNPMKIGRTKGNGKHLSDMRKSTRQSDSTDEDSGIESIMRIAKEIS